MTPTKHNSGNGLAASAGVETRIARLIVLNMRSIARHCEEKRSRSWRPSEILFVNMRQGILGEMGSAIINDDGRALLFRLFGVFWLPFWSLLH
jgi:hypothetical protein